MSEHAEGLTLEGLAERLETLERENAGLRQKVAALTGSGKGRTVVDAIRRYRTAPEVGQRR